MQITFSSEDNAVLLHLEPLRKELVFEDLSYALKHRRDTFYIFFSFLAQKNYEQLRLFPNFLWPTLPDG